MPVDVCVVVFFFFFKQKTAYEMLRSLVGSEMCIRDRFKLREGMPIGVKVTLRGDRMWGFLDRLLSVALPRIRDFRGLSPTQFDGAGNDTFGVSEQSIFHEIDFDKVDRPRGMDITVVTTAPTNDEGRALLRALGFPYKES